MPPVLVQRMHAIRFRDDALNELLGYDGTRCSMLSVWKRVRIRPVNTAMSAMVSMNSTENRRVRFRRPRMRMEVAATGERTPVAEDRNELAGARLGQPSISFVIVSTAERYGTAVAA